MAKTDPASLVNFLRSKTSRTRVGLWRSPLDQIGKEAEIAAHLGIEALDISKYYLSGLASGAEFARLSSAKVIQTLDKVASSNGKKDCVLIYNLDLLLAGIKVDERQQVWQNLFNHFPNRPRAIIIFISENASLLLPTENLLEKWQGESRLI